MDIFKINSICFRIISMVIVFSIFGFLPDANGQKEKERTRIKLYYSKLPDGYKKLTIGLLAGKGKDMSNVANADILLTALANDSIVELATIQTDEEGSAILLIEPDYQFPVDEEGKTLFEASYDGSKEYRSSSNDVEVADLDLEISFTTEDSVNYVHVNAYQILPEGDRVPVEELDIKIGVARLLSVLPLGETETDEEGYASFEFPYGLPGDSTGNLMVVARIEDSDDYGTVEKRSESNWGVPVSYELETVSRQLWTNEAPLWMIISVFIVLAGAWYHFFLSVYKLSKIRKIKETIT